MGSFSWDYHIAKFNLQNPDKSEIDVSYLFTLSDEVLPVLDGNKDLLNNDFMFQEGFRRYMQNGLVELKYRENKFIEDRAQYSWLSWNYSDFKTGEYLKNNNIERSNR